MKIGKLILSIITLLIAGILVFAFCSMIESWPTADTVENAIGQLFTLPIAILLLIMSYSCCVGSIMSSIFTIPSSSKAVMIIAIILLVLAVAVLGVNIYGTLQFVEVLNK